MNCAFGLGISLLACMSCLAQTGKTSESTDNLDPKLEKMPEPDQEVTGDDFLDLVLHRLRATAPCVQFLSNAVGLT